MMYARHDSLYQDATLFDQGMALVARRFAAWLPRSAALRWRLAFEVMGGLFGLLAIVALFAGLGSAHGVLDLIAPTTALAGLLATSHFFWREAGRLIPRNPVQVSVPEPAVPVLAASAPVQTAPEDVGTPLPTPQQFLLAVREAGINVRIAKVLYTAGVRSPHAVCQASDAALLAIRGVGPATLKKLRAHFTTV